MLTRSLFTRHRLPAHQRENFDQASGAQALFLCARLTYSEPQG
jgi:hypothetical protein